MLVLHPCILYFVLGHASKITYEESFIMYLLCSELAGSFHFMRILSGVTLFSGRSKHYFFLQKGKSLIEVRFAQVVCTQYVADTQLKTNDVV